MKIRFSFFGLFLQIGYIYTSPPSPLCALGNTDAQRLNYSIALINSALLAFREEFRVRPFTRKHENVQNVVSDFAGDDPLKGSPADARQRLNVRERAQDDSRTFEDIPSVRPCVSLSNRDAFNLSPCICDLGEVLGVCNKHSFTASLNQPS